MIAGHFGFAAAVKGQERQVPLWSLMLATAWLDIVFAPLLAAGIEEIESGDGYGDAVIHADYTHSLVGALILAALFGLVAAIPWGKRAGVVLAGVAFSHWLLDLVVHRSDMPILPGNLGDLPLLGFGLWQVPGASAIVELALVLLGAYLYWRAATRTAIEAGGDKMGLANVVGGLVLVAGIATLAVDVLLG